MNAGSLNENKINGDACLISEIMNENKQYVIPFYQRPYAWDTTNVEELIDDLITHMETYDINEKSPEYFLGSIVVYSDKDNKLQIIDGQQRILTLNILFSILVDLYGDVCTGGARTIATELWSRLVTEESMINVNVKKGYRLELKTKEDDNFFKKYICTKDGINKLVTDKALDNDFDKLSETCQNILRNTRAMYDKIKEMGEKKALKLVTVLISKCRMILVVSQNESMAFRIFSILNDRGKSLSFVDILKASIISAIPENDRLDYAEKWESFEKEAGRDKFQNIFTHIRMLKVRDKAKSSVKEELDRYVVPEKQPQKFVNDVLEPLVNNYQKITKAKFCEDSKRINNLLEWLGRIDNIDWQPAALLLLSNFSGDKALLEQYLGKLERLAAMMFINRYNVNQRIARYREVLEQVYNPVEAFASGEKYVFEFDADALEQALALKPKEQVDLIKNLNADVYNNRAAQYILLRLNSTFIDDSQKTEYGTITIEHILPQIPSADSEWMKIFPNEIERRGLTNILGNLCLLSRRKNAQAQNYIFSKKKDEYFLTDGKSTSFEITRRLKDEEKWDKETIEKAQTEGIRRFTELWELDAKLLDEEEHELEEKSKQKIKRRPPLNFKEMEIPCGEELVYVKNPQVKVIVNGVRTVLYQGKEKFLSEVTQALLDLPYAVKPTDYWEYKGRNLQEIYDEVYPKEKLN